MAAKPNRIPPDRQAPSGKPDDPADKSLMAQAPGEGVDVEEYLTVADDPNKPYMEEDADGYVTIGEAAEQDSPEDSTFYENLALVIPEPILSRIATDLMRRIDQDKDARAKRVEQYEMALRRTGMGKDAPGGAEFEGASKVVHPMITEACIDYCSRIMKELMPISGPVKPKLIGVPTTEKTERAERISEHMNYQITQQIKEARAVLETTFTQVPLGGVAYILQYWDHRLKRPRWRSIQLDHVYIPYTAEDFYSATRRTYEEILPQVDFQQRVDDGMYRDCELPKASSRPEENKAQEANNKVEGKQDDIENLDGDRGVLTCMSYLEVTDDVAGFLDEEEPGGLYPYLVSIDRESKKVLSFYRDWEEADEAHEPIEHLFEFGFIPWRGALSIGLGQIIDGLSAAATGALRALLDSAHANNSMTAFVMKGSGVSGQSNQAKIGCLTEIEHGLETDDIRKLVMPPPFNPPSSVLFQLLGMLIETAKGVVRTSMDETSIDQNTNVPVGTQLSRVEEGLVVFSAVHGRAHAALDRLLMGLHRLNRLYLPDTIRVDAAGKELLVRRADYEGPCDVQPVSDPTIYSDQQRFAQIQAMKQNAMMFPTMFNIREILKREMVLWKIQDPDQILVDQPVPSELNAVNENLSMVLGKPVAAFPDQDHLSHLQVLTDFMTDPNLGANPLVAPQFLPMALKHATEHLGLLYVKTVVDTVTAASKVPAEQLMSNDPEVKAMYDKLLAEASTTAMPGIAQQLQGIMPKLQAAMAQMQQLAPKPPLDPALAAVQAAGAETSRKAAADQAGNALAQAKLAEQAQDDQQKNAINWTRAQAMTQNAQTAAAAKIQTTLMDNQAAQDISDEKIESGHGSGLTDGGGFTH